LPSYFPKSVRDIGIKKEAEMKALKGAQKGVVSGEREFIQSGKARGEVWRTKNCRGTPIYPKSIAALHTTGKERRN